MLRRNRLAVLFFVLILLLLLPPPADAAIIVEIYPSLAPNKNASGTGWNAYAANATASLIANSGNFGNRQTDPSAYEIVSGAITAKELVGSDAAPVFHSWHGEANPPVPFDKEHGNRLQFGLRMMATTGEKIQMTGITYSVKSDDPAPTVFSAAGSFSSYAFSDSRVGVLYGTDGALGGGDDTLITSGTGPVEGVDALFYVGVSVGLQAGATGTDAERLASAVALADIETPFNIKATYTLGGVSSFATVSVVPVPEPASAFAIFAASAAVLLRRKR